MPEPITRIKRPVFRGFLGIPDQGFFPFCLFVIGQAPGWFPGGKNPLNTGFFIARTVSLWVQEEGETVSESVQGVCATDGDGGEKGKAPAQDGTSDHLPKGLTGATVGSPCGSSRLRDMAT